MAKPVNYLLDFEEKKIGQQFPLRASHSDFIINSVCAVYGMTREEVIAKDGDHRSRKSQLATAARQMVMLMLRECTGMSLEVIAELTERDNHTTIAHALKMVREKIKKDPVYKLAVEELKDELIKDADHRRVASPGGIPAV